MKKPAPEPESCGACECWKPNENDEHGACRRRPPCVISTEMGPISISPATAPDSWCAEFLRKYHS